MWTLSALLPAAVAAAAVVAAVVALHLSLTCAALQRSGRNRMSTRKAEEMILAVCRKHPEVSFICHCCPLRWQLPP